MKVEQIPVFLENKPGTLEHATRALKEANINIRTLSAAETADFGILRLIVNDVEKANKALKDSGFRVSKTPCCRCGSSRQTGRTAQHHGSLLQRRHQRRIPLRLCGKSGQNAVIIFRFDMTVCIAVGTALFSSADGTRNTGPDIRE